MSRTGLFPPNLFGHPIFESPLTNPGSAFLINPGDMDILNQNVKPINWDSDECPDCEDTPDEDLEPVTCEECPESTCEFCPETDGGSTVCDGRKQPNS